MRVHIVMPTERFRSAHISDIRPVRAFEEFAVLIARDIESFGINRFYFTPTPTQAAHERTVNSLRINNILAFAITRSSVCFDFHVRRGGPAFDPANKRRQIHFAVNRLRPDYRIANGNIANREIHALALCLVDNNTRNRTPRTIITTRRYISTVVVQGIIGEIAVFAIQRNAINSFFSKVNQPREIAVMLRLERAILCKVILHILEEFAFGRSAKNIVERIVDGFGRCFRPCTENGIDAKSSKEFRLRLSLGLLRGIPGFRKLLDSTFKDAVESNQTRRIPDNLSCIGREIIPGIPRPTASTIPNTTTTIILESGIFTST